MQDVSYGNTNICEYCGVDAATCSMEEEVFLYGSGDDAVELKAQVAVWECASCGAMFMDGAAEVARHAAVCRHLGRLTPEEIATFRRDGGLTQEQMADVLGVGVASIKRWELGNQIQSVSSDRFLRLSRIPTNLLLLKLMQAGVGTEPRFQTALPEGAVKSAERFKLRRESAERSIG